MSPDSAGNLEPDRIRVMAADNTTAEQTETMALLGNIAPQLVIPTGGEGVKDSQAGRIRVARAARGTVPADDQLNSDFYDDPPAPGLYEPRREKLGHTELITENQIKKLVIIGVIGLLFVAELGYAAASIVLSVRTGQVEGLQQFYTGIFNLLVPVLFAAGGYAVGRRTSRKHRDDD